MKPIPNEGIMDLQTIRWLEYGDHFLSTQDLAEDEWELDYDENLRFTEVRSLDEMDFAFRKNEKV